MKQYCRYCVHCIPSEPYYCTDRGWLLSEAQIKRVNTCREFILTEDVDSGKEYKPREHKTREKREQADPLQLRFEEE